MGNRGVLKPNIEFIEDMRLNYIHRNAMNIITANNLSIDSIPEVYLKDNDSILIKPIKQQMQSYYSKPEIWNMYDLHNSIRSKAIIDDNKDKFLTHSRAQKEKKLDVHENINFFTTSVMCKASDMHLAPFYHKFIKE